MKMSSDKANALEGDLTSTKHKLLELKEQLEMTEKVQPNVSLSFIFFVIYWNGKDLLKHGVIYVFTNKDPSYTNRLGGYV